MYLRSEEGLEPGKFERVKEMGEREERERERERDGVVGDFTTCFLLLVVASSNF
jgi:hypothetical protein